MDIVIAVMFLGAVPAFIGGIALGQRFACQEYEPLLERVLDVADLLAKEVNHLRVGGTL